MSDDASDLTDVGGDKPMGYLPLPYIKELGINPDTLIAELSARGVTALVLEEGGGEGQAQIRGGAILAYYQPALDSLLQEPNNLRILKTVGWPTDADGFARKTMGDLVPKGALRNLVIQAYSNSNEVSR